MCQRPCGNIENTASRRDFIKKSSLIVAGSAVTGGLNVAKAAHIGVDDTIRIGLVGCGRRGTSAAGQALLTKGPTKLVAMGDVFNDRLQSSLRGIKGAHPNRVDVPPDRQFFGFDAYLNVLQQDLDLVILATPPGFRPVQFEAAVAAGKHVFMEKPVAVDAPGVRRVLSAAETAKTNGLAVAVGLQKRHERRYVETIHRIQDGAIGDIILTRAYWNGNCAWLNPREERQSEMEYQLRNWYYFNWLCGDHIVEQHIQNIDVVNWLKNVYPTTAQGQGGRQVRTGKEFGEIFDHHMVEFTYADGSKMYSQCRQIHGCWPHVSEYAHGTMGTANIQAATIYDNRGERTWRYGRGGGNGHQLEQDHLFAAIRTGEMPNEGEYGALSTMTAIMGRMATYSGNVVAWDDALQSRVEVSPKISDLDTAPPVRPNKDGVYPVAMPGTTKAV